MFDVFPEPMSKSITGYLLFLTGCKCPHIGRGIWSSPAAIEIAGDRKARYQFLSSWKIERQVTRLMKHFFPYHDLVIFGRVGKVTPFGI
jgi:hypothetical protein